MPSAAAGDAPSAVTNNHRDPDTVEWAGPFTLPSPRAVGTERGCVEDQPQRVGSSKTSGACSVLRLVDDDTAALRFQWGRGEGEPYFELNSHVHAFWAFVFIHLATKAAVPGRSTGWQRPRGCRRIQPRRRDC